uniref:Protein kinase domain-containing protein n=1 Tax=Ditylum brightwellii TaxID=49249 RepID=A0A7S2EBQ1_9STRA|mmetsp:Transcript_23351/g.34826  ORF Transcript_23351/g.34826 Transcript_23351/m.34826 type:complete len:508 (+) Transcript_23351:881-2404(+)
MQYLPDGSSFEPSMTVMARSGLPPKLSAWSSINNGGGGAGGSAAGGSGGNNTPTIRSGAGTARSARSTHRNTPRVFGEKVTPRQTTTTAAAAPPVAANVIALGDDTWAQSTELPSGGDGGATAAASPIVNSNSAPPIPHSSVAAALPSTSSSSCTIADAELLVSLVVGSIARTVASFHRAGLVHGSIRASNVFAKWIKSSQQQQQPLTADASSSSPNHNNNAADQQQQQDFESVMARIERGDHLEVCLTDVGTHLLRASVPVIDEDEDDGEQRDDTINHSDDDDDDLPVALHRNRTVAPQQPPRVRTIHFNARCIDRAPPPEFASEIVSKIVQQGPTAPQPVGIAGGAAAAAAAVGISTSSVMTGYRWVELSPPDASSSSSDHQQQQASPPRLPSEIAPPTSTGGGRNASSSTTAAAAGMNTPSYVANPTFQSDIWELGLLVIELLLGAAPLVPESVVRSSPRASRSQSPRQHYYSSAAAALLQQQHFFKLVTAYNNFKWNSCHFDG